ncbi:Cyclopentanone 1,2-monooxygenase (CPMO) [Mortierella sp. GBA43]|nr:Cyclopentanone 1,2-monooxygenase (CPMO) [Mortierella sp. GBA43]
MTTTTTSSSLSPQDDRVKKRVAVIGAGCTGLVAIKECLAEPDHFEVVCFEQAPYIGGLWRYMDVTDDNPNPHSSVYKSTVINTSKSLTTFSDYAIPGNWPTYLHNQKLAQYFDMYAEHFGLVQHIRFRTKVVEIQELKDEQNRWLVRFHTISPASPDLDSTSFSAAAAAAATATTMDPPIQEEIFDNVMMCTGHHSVPRYPSFPGMHPTDPDAYTGKQLHSHFYREVSQDIKGKNVVVVGLGNSAVDLAVELSMNQCQVHLSVRSPVWIVPRWVAGRPLDQILTRFAFWLPSKVFQFATSKIVKWSSPRVHPMMEPRRSLFGAQPTINSLLHERISTGTVIPQVNIRRIGPGKRVEFEDDTVLEDVEAIYWCTGYHLRFPALDPMIVSDGHEDLEQGRVWLWNHMLPPRHPNMAFIGLFQPSGAFMPVAELQCRFLVQAWSGQSSASASSVLLLSSSSAAEKKKQKKKHKRKKSIPDNVEQMDREIDRVHQLIRRQYGESSPRHAIQVNYTVHSDYLAKKIGCYPSFRKLVKAFGVVEAIRLKKESFFGPPAPAFYRLVGPHCWVGNRDEDKGENDGKGKDVDKGKDGNIDRGKKEDGSKKKRTTQVGEAARQVIWGYKGHPKYVNSKYLRDESNVLLAGKNHARQQQQQELQLQQDMKNRVPGGSRWWRSASRAETKAQAQVDQLEITSHPE